MTRITKGIPQGNGNDIPGTAVSSLPLLLAPYEWPLYAYSAFDDATGKATQYANYKRPKQQRQGVSKISNDSRSCKMGKPPKISAQNASCDHYMCRSNKNIWLSLPIVYPSVSNPPRQDRRRHIPQALAMNSQVSIKPRRPSSLLLHCLLILRPGVTTPLGVD